jgi:hypothetical protein
MEQQIISINDLLLKKAGTIKKLKLFALKNFGFVARMEIHLNT